MSQINVDVGECLLLAAPSGHRVQAHVARLVIHLLGGGVDGRVGYATGSQSQWFHYFALGLAQANDRSWIDQYVARSIAAKLHLGSLLVAACLLRAIAWSAGVVAHRPLAAQIAKVPNPIGLTAHHVVVMIGLTGKLEGVLAAEEEGRLVLGVQILSVLGAGGRQWLATVGARTGRRHAGEPVIGQAWLGIVDALAEFGRCRVAQRASVVVARERDVLLERHQHARLVGAYHG